MIITSRRLPPSPSPVPPRWPSFAAPAASAAASDPHLACIYQGEGNSQCESPGNAQFTATPHDVPYPQQYPFLFGGPLLVFHHDGGHR